MAPKYRLEVLTAEGELYRTDDAEFVVLPGAEGELGVLDHHVPLVVTLSAGPLTITQENSQEEVLFVAGGFADISQDKDGETLVSVLADAGERAGDVDEAAAEERRGDRPRSCSASACRRRTTPRRRRCWSARLAASASPRSRAAVAPRAVSGRCAGKGLVKQLQIHGGTTLSRELRSRGPRTRRCRSWRLPFSPTSPAGWRTCPASADVENAAGILEDLGATVSREADGVLSITAEGTIGSQVPDQRAKVMRASILFMGPLLARNGRAVLAKPGGDDIGMRRVDQHVAGMIQMGATVSEESGDFVCEAKHLHGADILLDMPTVTGTENLMMAATLAEGATTISNAAREPHISDLATALNGMGARISGAGTDRIEIEGVDRLGGGSHRVCPDYLEAGTYALAVAAAGGDVRLVDCPVIDLRSLITKLRQADVQVDVEEDALRVRRDGPLRPVDLITWTHPGFATDLQPQYTAVMTQAEGTAVVQEFLFENRFNYVSELNALGASIELFPHRRGIRVQGPSALRGNVVTIPDIRAGAALMIGALCARGGTLLGGVEHLERGYQDMAGKLSGLGAQVREPTERSLGSEVDAALNPTSE